MGLKPVAPQANVQYERHRLHLPPSEAADPRTLTSLACEGWEYRITVRCGWYGSESGVDLWFERPIRSMTPLPPSRRNGRNGRNGTH
jgi:hypothetical protein